MFHVRRRPADGSGTSSQQQAAQRRRKKKLSGGSTGGGGNNQPAASSAQSVNRLAETGGGEDVLPYLVELNPDGSEVRQGANQPIRRHVISSSTVTEVGSERPATSPAAGK